jgi:hypothetical protein
LNWETNGCPLNGKCSYYDKIKNDASLLEKCPYSHASDESNFIVKQINPHKCPHLAKAHAEKVMNVNVSQKVQDLNAPLQRVPRDAQQKDVRITRKLQAKDARSKRRDVLTI